MRRRRLLRLDVLQRGVVGCNTSAVSGSGRCRQTGAHVLDEDISTHNQEGTIHFHYLLDVNGGLLRVARTLDEQCSCSPDSLAPEGGGDPNARASCEGFIRPFGLRRPATPTVCRRVERLAAVPAPQPRPMFEDACCVSCCIRRGALQLLLLTQPHRKRVRLAIKKVFQDGRRRVFVW
jgi:hypothetical protein